MPPAEIRRSLIDDFGYEPSEVADLTDAQVQSLHADLQFEAILQHYARTKCTPSIGRESMEW